MSSKYNLYIVGAGNFGREVECLLDMVPEAARDFELKGYINDDPETLLGKQSDLKVMGRIDDFQFQPGDRALLAIGDSAARKEVYLRLRGRVGFATFIHPNVTRFKFTEVGEGSIIVSNCVISTGVRIGRFAVLNQGVQVGHDCTLGEFCSLMSGVNLGGDCSIGDGVFMGLAATVIPGVKVGESSKIGSGSVVIKNVKPEITVFGNPAKILF